MGWLKTNWRVVAICALLLVIAFGSAVDGYRTRKLLKAAQVNLEETAKAKEKELSAARAAWEGHLASSDRKLAPILRERDALRTRLAEIEARRAEPWAAPSTDNEIVSRFAAMGYKVAVSGGK